MTFPIDKVRAAFPSLETRDDGRARVYLDNPAGTQVSREVADAAAGAMLFRNANLGGYFASSIEAEAVVDGAHRAMALFLGAASEREIVIGPSMTALTFSLSRGIARTLSPGDEIVVTRMDHDANISPWLAIAQERGATVRWVPFDRDSWTIDPAAFERALSSKTRIAAFTYASNLTGSINDVRTLSALARDAGALSYVDAVQFAPHGLVDVARLGCDFLACSSYKFFGPHMGIVWAREDVLDEVHAYKVRPSSEALPWRFEPGTPQIEQHAALSATVEYFTRLGSDDAAPSRASVAAAFAAATAWEMSLASDLVEGLRALPGVRVHGITDAKRFDERVPTVSFTHSDVAPQTIARDLAARGIFVWSGHNYALEVVRSLGIDEATGVVRIGLAHYNTPQEVRRTLAALDEVLTTARSGFSVPS